VAALALGQMLDRVVILPRFHCGNITSVLTPVNPPRSARRRRLGGAATSECPLNCLLNVTAFDAQFEGAYRESSFLRHQLVPTAVRRDRSPPLDVPGRLKSSSDDALSADNGTLPTTAVLLRSDDVVRLFGSLPNRVLVFRSLYRVQPRFAGEHQQRDFDGRVSRAFRRGTYRQM